MSKRIVKKVSPSEQLQRLTLRDRAICYKLVGGEYCHTQTDVARCLDLCKSTVNNTVNKLLRAEAIYKRGGQVQNIFYSRGRNYHIVEELLKADKRSGMLDSFLNHRVIKGGEPRTPRLIIWRTYLGKGGWIHLQVLSEGKLDFFDRNGERVELFGNTPSKYMMGTLAWYGQIMTRDGKVSIRYYKGTNTGKMTFGISPKGILMGGNEINIPTDDILEMFYTRITGIFLILEKFGGWSFKKDENGNFDFQTKALPEFGADRYLTTIMKKERGEDFGIPGVTEDWHDRSADAGEGGEYETSNPELVEALHFLPETHSIVRVHSRDITELDDKVKAISKRVDTLEETMKGAVE